MKSLLAFLASLVIIMIVFYGSAVLAGIWLDVVRDTMEHFGA